MASMMFAHAVDTALVRLSKIYGPEFAAKYGDVPANELRDLWQQELGGVNNALDAIAWALHHLPDRCPNVVQFRSLCNTAPRPQMQAMLIDSDTPTRGPTPTELATLYALRDGIRARKPSKQWAYDIVAKHERGEFSGSSYALRMAREVVAEDSGYTQTPSDIDEQQLDLNRPTLEARHDDDPDTRERAQA